MDYTDDELLDMTKTEDTQTSVEQDDFSIDDPFVDQHNDLSWNIKTGQSNSEDIGNIVTGQEYLRVTEEDAVIAAYVGLSERDNIKIGSYYLVPYPNGEVLFCRVKELAYTQRYPSEDADETNLRRTGKMELDEDEYKLIAYFEPICILYENENEEMKRRIVDRIPKPNTRIANAQDLRSIQTGLNIPNKGIFLGHLSIGGELVKTESYPDIVAYYLQNDDSENEPLIFRHGIICGSTGTGKTFVSKNVLRQYIADGVRYKIRDPEVSGDFKPCVIIIDPQDEYSQISDDNPDLNNNYKSKLGMQDIQHGKVKETKTFTAKVGSESYQPTTSAKNKEFTIPFNIVRNNHWLIHGGEMNENQIHALERLINDYFSSSRPNYTYSDFIDFITNQSTKEDYTENKGTIHEATYDSIIRKVENNHFKMTFDKGADNITDILDQIFVPGQVSVFPTEYISSSRSRDLIILTLMSMIVDNKLKNTGDKRIKNTPLILGLDEAHRYLSSAKTTQAKAIVGKFTEAARQGRKESLGLMLITQDPQDIADSIMKQVNTKIILNLNNESAIASLKVSKKYEKRIPFLKRGQMIVHSPDNSDTVELIGLEKCTVKHA